MNTKNTTQFPQTVEIPLPLEVHPSIETKLADALISFCEHITNNPQALDVGTGYNGYNFKTGGERVCVLCHCTRLTGWLPPEHKQDEHWAVPGGAYEALPNGHHGRIYWPHYWPKGHHTLTTESVVSRVEHFLRTGE